MLKNTRNRHFAHSSKVSFLSRQGTARPRPKDTVGLPGKSTRATLCLRCSYKCTAALQSSDFPNVPSMAHAEMGVKMQWAETASQGKRQPKQAGSTLSNSCTCQETSLEAAGNNSARQTGAISHCSFQTGQNRKSMRCSGFVPVSGKASQRQTQWFFFALGSHRAEHKLSLFSTKK